jgi:hypothetical protein
MTNAAAFALGAFTVLALPFLSCRPLANDHEFYDCSRKTLEDPSGGLSLRVMP